MSVSVQEVQRLTRLGRFLEWARNVRQALRKPPPRYRIIMDGEQIPLRAAIWRRMIGKTTTRKEVDVHIAWEERQ